MDMTVAQLYKITHTPSGREYFGSTWKQGKTYLDRFEEHMNHNGGKWISKLLNEGSSPKEFKTELLLIGEVEYVCDIESQLALNNLWPKGLNGNAGKNIVRTPEGQAKVVAAVSKARKGAKHTEEFKARHREIMIEATEYKRGLPANEIPGFDQGKGVATQFGNKPAWNTGLTGENSHWFGREHTEEAKEKMRKPKVKICCMKCKKEFGLNGFKRWEHFENCLG